MDPMLADSPQARRASRYSTTAYYLTFPVGAMTFFLALWVAVSTNSALLTFSVLGIGLVSMGACMAVAVLEDREVRRCFGLVPRD